MRRPIAIFLCTLLLGACSTPVRQSRHEDDVPRYLRLTDTLGITRADILSPWKEGELIARYYLVPRDSLAQADCRIARCVAGLPMGTVIPVPLRHIATTSATHVGYLKALGMLDSITCMSTPELVYNHPAHPVADIGTDYQLNVERLLLARPDGLIATQYGMQITGIDRVEQMGIPVLYMVEWLEQSPLARAGWLRFLAALTGREEQADSVLSEVHDHYACLTALTRDISPRRTIASGQSYRGTWYVPSGHSYMERLMRDAGADYCYAEQVREGSIPLSMEEAVLAFGEADVWVGASAESLRELRETDERHTWMRAYRNGEVWNWKGAANSTGGSDFWETGVVHPDYILADLIHALYPTLLPDSTHFIKRLE